MSFTYKNFIKKIVAAAIILSAASVSFAQVNTGSPVINTGFCPYTFNKNFQLGSRDNDIVILQKILNADTRTTIAQTGVASPGQETNYFGAATQSAVKKFQALFIEYIGVANGVFGPKTRTVMNAICNGEYFVNGSGSVYSAPTTQTTTQNNLTTTASASTTTSVATNTDKLAPAIFVRSNVTAVNAGSSFRVIVSASEPIVRFEADTVIIEGGSVGEIRKLAPNMFSILVTPNDGARVVVVQVEADKVSDLAGNLNDNASNEIRVGINQTVIATTTTATVATTTTDTGFDFNSIMNRILASVATSSTVAANTTNTSCSNGATNPPTCNSFVNNTNNSNTGSGSSGSSNSGQNSQNSLMQMLMLSKLMGGNGGGLFGSGTKSPTPNINPNPSPSTDTNKNPDTPTVPCSVVNKPGCSADVPTPPVKPSDLGGVPSSGEIIKEIKCEKVQIDKSGTVNDCKGATRIYLVKDLLEGSSTKYIIMYTGLSKDKDGKKMSDLAIGSKFYEGQINKLQRLQDFKICKTYNPKTKPSCTEESEVVGKSVYGFPNEEQSSFASPEKSKTPEQQVNDTTNTCKNKFSNDYELGGFSATVNDSISKIEKNYPQCKGYLTSNAMGTDAVPTCGNDPAIKRCIALANDRYNALSGTSRTTKNAVNYIDREYPECSGKLTWGYTTTDYVCK